MCATHFKLQLQLIRLICISMRLKTLGFTKRLDLKPYHITNDTDAMFLFLNAPMRILLFFYYFWCCINETSFHERSAICYNRFSMFILIPDANYFRWTIANDVITASSIAHSTHITHAIFSYHLWILNLFSIRRKFQRRKKFIRKLVF